MIILCGIEGESTDVEIIMSRRIESVTKETPAKEAAIKMLKKDLHHLLVVENDKIAGIISSMGFVKLVANWKV